MLHFIVLAISTTLDRIRINVQRAHVANSDVSTPLQKRCEKFVSIVDIQPSGSNNCGYCGGCNESNNLETRHPRDDDPFG